MKYNSRCSLPHLQRVWAREKKLQSLRKIVEDAIGEYQKYRSEVVARLISMDEKGFKIMFTGHFCQVCGISDEYQVVLYFLEEKGLRAEVAEVKEFDDEFVANFRILGQK